jgi:hypothetical protein
MRRPILGCGGLRSFQLLPANMPDSGPENDFVVSSHLAEQSKPIDETLQAVS